MPPKVTVATCSYNRPEMLRAAVNSMRNQTDPDWEHFIYDDNSSDPAVSDVLAWAQQDPRVRVWYNKENVDRPSVLWNRMLDCARGRYFTVLDDDNQKLPEFVEKMSRVLEEDPTVDVVTCGFLVVDTQGNKRAEHHLNMETTPDRIALSSTTDGGAMMYRREVFERAGYFSEAIRTNEDWDWLRRAVHVGRVVNLPEIYVTYCTHQTNRMVRADALGNAVDELSVRGRVLSESFDVQTVMPTSDQLTRSQLDVCASVGRGLAQIPWVRRVNGNPGKRDLTIIVSPLHQTHDELSAAVSGSPRILTLHMEDPYAMKVNTDAIKYLQRLSKQSTAEVWVCTNDASTVEHYKDVVGARVIVWPALSADSTMAVEPAERDIDVLMCGYAYPSRKKFMAALLPLLGKMRVTLVGDGWERFAGDASVLPTQSLQETYRLHARAHTVVCLHRSRGDCSDGPAEPITVNRGFMEGYHGARVFMDSTRTRHAHGSSDVIFYTGPNQLAGMLQSYLHAEPYHVEAKKRWLAQAEQFAEKCRSVYTYKTRLSRILNCIRSPRYLAEIP